MGSEIARRSYETEELERAKHLGVENRPKVLRPKGVRLRREGYPPGSLRRTTDTRRADPGGMERWTESSHLAGQ